MKKRISTFSLSMLLTVFLAAGFARNFDFAISLSILVALTATLIDIFKPEKKLKAVSAFFSIFSATYSLTLPHFSTLPEVYGLAISSEKIKDTDPGSVALLYGIAAAVLAIGMIFKFIMIRKTYKNIKTGGI